MIARQNKLPFFILLGALICAAFLISPFSVSAIELPPIIQCATHTGAEGERIPGMLSPLTPLCTICDLLTLVQTGFNFVWLYLSIPIAAAMMAYGGVLMVLPTFTGSSTQAGKGRKVLGNAVLGLVIVFFAWIGVDSLLKIMGAKQNEGKFGPWNKIECKAPPISIIGGPVDVIPVELQCPQGVTEKWVSGSNVCDKTVQRAIVTHTSERTTAHFGSACSASVTSRFDGTIQNAAQQYGIPVNRLKAIIMLESSGNPNARGTVGEIGLMQLKPGTARQYVPELQGQPLSAVTEWLKEPTNNIRAGSLYYKALLRDNHGNHDRATRGYNGGAAANLPSRDCPGLTRSECEWDNIQQTIPNTGYRVTRNYSVWINNCQSKLGG